MLLMWRHRKKSKELKEAKRMVCDCTLPPLVERERGVMPCGEDCLNRMLMIEWWVSWTSQSKVNGIVGIDRLQSHKFIWVFTLCCSGSRCPCGDYCTNKRFQRVSIWSELCSRYQHTNSVPVAPLNSHVLHFMLYNVYIPKISAPAYRVTICCYCCNARDLDVVYLHAPLY